MKSEIVLKGIVRTPLYSINKIRDINKESLLNATEDSNFIEAIENSSPEFLREINKIKEEKVINIEKLENFYITLYKYFTRSSTRCTPFGLFATVGYVELIEDYTVKKTALNSDINRQIRLDPRCFQLIIDYFNTKLRYLISFTINNSIYNFGNSEFRYFERKRTKDDIYYELSKIFSNEVTEKVLVFFNSPNNYSGFKAIWGTDTNEQNIVTFFDEIIDSDLIISEFEFCTKKNDYLDALIEKLKKYSNYENINSDINTLIEISLLLKDQQHSIHSIYTKLKELLLSFKIEVNDKDLVHIDSHRKINKNVQIDPQLRFNLTDLTGTLLKLFPLKNDTFRKFIIDYKRRYEDRIMPLLNVLDPETGIGFNSSIDDEDLPISFELTSNSGSVELSKTEVFLFNKLRNLTKDENEILINDSELADFGANYNNLSESMTAFISLLGNEKVLFNSVSGSSGINLMSRFAYLDQNISNLCKDIFIHEKKCNESNLLVEINHIPELKASNLLFFDSIRDFEIDCHINSDIQGSKKIALDDILIQITNHGIIELLSKKNGKRIIPKLSSSINYNRNSIAVYKFLSELQYQTSVKSLQFHWGSLNSLFTSFPRVVYKNIIVSPAIWIIDSAGVNNLLKSKEGFLHSFLLLKNNQNIPDTFYISRDVYDDNKLYIDIRNDISINVLKKELKKINKCVITECFIDAEDKFCDNENNNFCHELMIPVLHHKINHSSISTFESNNMKPSDLIFTPGSKWISLKIYLGVKFVDAFLVNDLGKLIDKLLKNNLISKWFFVRYLDDDFHLRIRFEVVNKVDISVILSELHDIIGQHINSGHIHNVVYDSYKREIERYRPELIEYCESIFHYDSFIVLKFLENERSFDEKLLFACIGIDSYLDMFKFDLSEKIDVIETISGHFFTEFGGGKKLLDSLNKLYRDRIKLIENEFELFNSIIKANTYFELIKYRRSSLESILTNEKIQNFKEQKEVVFSLLHMFLNRLFESNPRKKELVVYFFLVKYYNSIKYRKLAENDSEQLSLIHL